MNTNFAKYLAVQIEQKRLEYDEVIKLFPNLKDKIDDAIKIIKGSIIPVE